MTDAMSTDEQGVVFVGLPESGKTTYLALVFRAITMELTGDLKLGTFNDDRVYVNEIAETLAACERAVHTEVEQHEQLRVSLVSSSDSFVLRIPDMSGERWLHAIQDRTWSPDLDSQVANARGFVLFVHAEALDRQATIDEAAVDPDDLGHTAARESDSVDDADRTRSTQVAIVDLLQLIASRRPPLPLRLSLVASAWDRLGDNELQPRSWLADELPLLDQFLEANADWIETSVWGVSAQGGEFENPAEKATLLKRDVVERSIVKCADGTAGTVDGPLRWVLGMP
jgi:hypothetical protein